ncbi:hypothetical protein DYB32_009271 [Aphanomyces invadans]|uniref:DDE-1 domain-containing protein n=1 Tax=Aphanomyces invadans TaxID=157072 RepID=A0A3R7CU96_9STRA|nr:hypothetical protein DYB32_009271 [Aphanomyces invadans]
MDVATPKRRQRPKLAQKLNAVLLAEKTSVQHAAVTTGYPARCVHRWLQTKATMMSFKGSKTRKKNTGTCGGKPIIPQPRELVTYLKDLRCQEMVETSAHMIQFLRVDHMAWIEDYIATRKNGYNGLLRLLQRIADRHGFSKQTVCRQKKTQKDLEETCAAIAKQFHTDHPNVAMDCVFNADETGITYNMCPNTIWAVRGGGSYVSNSERHSYRMTALLTVRGDGVKLPIVFVIRGVAGGAIESNELLSIHAVTTTPCRKKPG